MRLLPSRLKPSRLGISRRLGMNLAFFFLGSIALIGYGLVNFVGNPEAKPIQVSTILANSDGLYPRFTVTYEGIDVGSVSTVKLVPRGVDVTMTLQPGTKLPANLGVRIGLANDLGEQQVDLVRIGSPRGVLHTGTVLPEVANGTPVEVGKVVALASKLLQAIPPSDLNELLRQSALALQGEGPNLRTILVSGELFAREVLHYRQEIDALLSNSPSVLDTITALSAPLHQALANTAALLSVVEAQSHQITSLFKDGTSLALTGTNLLDHEASNTACLVHDLGKAFQNLSEPANYPTTVQALDLAPSLISILQHIVQPGPAPVLTSNAKPAQAYWERTELLIPPASPPAESYAKPHSLPPVKPGAGCITVFGKGVGRVTQPNFFSSSPGAVVLAPSPKDSYVEPKP